jgi:hypothetical protein
MQSELNEMVDDLLRFLGSPGTGRRMRGGVIISRYWLSPILLPLVPLPNIPLPFSCQCPLSGKAIDRGMFDRGMGNKTMSYLYSLVGHFYGNAIRLQVIDNQLVAEVAKWQTHRT